MEKEFISYEIALALKELGFGEKCFGYYYHPAYSKQTILIDSVLDPNHTYFNEFPEKGDFPIIGNYNKQFISAPLYQQAINFLYICSNKQIDIELKGSDTYEERIRKIEQGCKDLWNLQNNKSN